MYEDQEVAKWRKKRPRQSKANRRSDHKHIYAPAYKVILGREGKVRGYYCPVCGKWKSSLWFWSAEDRAAWDAAHPDAVYVTIIEGKCRAIDFIKKI